MLYLHANWKEIVCVSNGYFFFIVVQIRPKESYACKDRGVARRLFRSRHDMIENFEEFAQWNLVLFSKKKYHYNGAFKLK